jgi:aspartate/methionine/tyrosine aminotransferase
MIFSNLAGGFAVGMNPLYRARDEALARGEKIIDLISGNVNQCGIVFPDSQLKSIFLDAIRESRTYGPDPLGQLVARRAIADYYCGQGLILCPEQILLTPGTSVSYFYCFKLLAQAGDEILCPSPSYPLFDEIAKLAGVQLTAYRLSESRQWEIDLDHLESRLTTRTRAVVLISPHNPTGMVASREQLNEVAEIVRRHKVAIVADEVFSEFLYDREHLPRPAMTSAPLVFTLNGFSKMFALPGLKLGWVAVSGDAEWVRKSLWTLELISDTFLPVNEMVQYSVPEIFRAGEDFLPSYVGWAAHCREIAVRALSQCTGIQYNPPAGGFYLTVRLLNEEIDEEKLTLQLLQKSNLLLHPGYFYDMPPPHLVMTFIQNHDVLQTALNRLCAQLC